MPCKYNDAKDFSEGLAAVMDDENYKYGFIDTTGREVVPCKYDYVGNFSEGLAAVKLDGKWGFVAVSGAGEQPTTPVEPEKPADPGITVDKIPAKGTAAASTQSVELDGKKVEFQMYALKDEKGSTNYIKLRDLGHILNGTKAQFNVGYSKETGITVTTGQAYQGNGSEMNTPFSGDRAYAGGGQSVQINGKAVELTAFVLTDDAGGGYTYFKLRDLGAALGFNVSWSKDRGVYVETDKPYVG